MKTYQVNFYPTNAEVKAKNETEAEELAKELFYNGELYCEVKSIKEINVCPFCRDTIGEDGHDCWEKRSGL